ncbi:unnamed protein product [Haemonchus placei]|uniref:Protein CUSTOS n=2 Tax=Haemonchus TaxID=6288 RepID=A0A0N4WFW6_HAEPC|nr:unnamed protein product [Haemonchus placei]
MTDKNDIGWMYEGAKSLVDKNFEKYSDAVNEQKPDAFDALLHTRTVFKPQPSSTKTSALESYVVATEDPLVAVKVKEETRRREVLENPLVKFKFQKMLKEMMAQKEAKGEKKKKKKKKKAKDGGKEKKEKKKKKARSSSEKNNSAKGSPKRKDSRSERARNGSDIASDTERESHRKHRSTDRTVKAVLSKSPVRQDRDRIIRRTATKECGERNHHGTSAEPSQADTEKPQKAVVHESEDPCTSKEERKDPKQIRAFDSHIPEHLRPKNFASDNDDDTEDEFDRREREHKKRFEGFGLVGVKEKEKHDESGPTENPYELSRKPALPVYQKPERRRPLTEEEKQAKLREMSENAAWRQSTRNSNLKRAKLAEEKEDEEDMRDKAPSFIRSQLNSAASDLTVEHRLQSNKKSLQRSHGYMEKKFTSK